MRVLTGFEAKRLTDFVWCCRRYLSIWIHGYSADLTKHLSKSEEFYGSLNIEDITDENAKKVFRNFKLKNLGDYRDLYMQSNIYLLADIFENFQKMYWNIQTLSCSISFCIRIGMASIEL